jgi:hypothetical protein
LGVLVQTWAANSLSRWALYFLFISSSELPPNAPEGLNAQLHSEQPKPRKFSLIIPAIFDPQVVESQGSEFRDKGFRCRLGHCGCLTCVDHEVGDGNEFVASLLFAVALIVLSGAIEPDTNPASFS